MRKIKVSDYIANYIASLGVKHVFLIPGGGNVSMIDAISKHKDLLNISNHHEQACAMAAEAYGRVGGNIGVCVTTVGPAATNTLTGIMGAWTDSIATLYLSGQVKREVMMTNTDLRQLGVQEINIVDIAKPITKYCEIVDDPNDIRYHLEKAVFLAKSGRPGPVLLDIPSDIQTCEVDLDAIKSFDPEKENLLVPVSPEFKDQMTHVLSLIKNARKPLIFAGYGIRLSGAHKEFLELAEKLNVPILTAMAAHDLIPTNHRLFAGRPGVFGDRAGNFAIQNADLLISIGARHHLWNVGYNYKEFARNATKVVVEIDINELNKKTVVPDVAIHCDAKLFITELLTSAEKKTDIDAWITRVIDWKEKYPVILPSYKDEKEYVNSYYFTEVLSDCLTEGDIIMTGVGTSFTGTLQSFKVQKDQRLFSSVGCASMGYDLPSAIGGWFATGKDRITLLTGDGSIMMNLQELQTIKHYKIPLKIFLINNNGYLAIKNTQNSFFGGNLVAVDEESGVSFPDFKDVAKTFGIGYLEINDHSNIKQIIEETLSYPGPVLCNIKMSPTQPLWPKVYSEKLADGTMVSKPLEDMFPFLEREEFEKNMADDITFSN